MSDSFEKDRASESRPESILRSWLANSEAWIEAVRSGSIQSRVIATDEAIVHAIKSCNVRRVVDIGCGEGWLVHRLVAEGYEAFGVDGSPALIQAADDVSRTEGRFLTATYEEIVAEPLIIGGPYDAAVCNFSLFEEDLSPLLRAIRSRLRSHGFLLIQTVHPLALSAGEAYSDAWKRETFEKYGAGFATPMPWYFRTIGSWISQVIQPGYRISRLVEPQPDGHDQPLSMILIARPATHVGA